MSITEIEYDHICLTVSNLARSIEFYEKNFGFRVAKRVGVDPSGKIARNPESEDLCGVKDADLKALFLTRGKLVLEFLEFASPKGPQAAPSANAVGAAHIGVVVKDVRAEYEKLKANGVNFVAPPVFNQRKQNYSVMMRDPDGIMVEIMESAALKWLVVE